MPQHLSALALVLKIAHVDPFKVQSDFARTYAAEVAQAASLGAITSQGPDGKYGRVWYITVTGLAALETWQKIMTLIDEQ